METQSPLPANDEIFPGMPLLGAGERRRHAPVSAAPHVLHRVPPPPACFVANDQMTADPAVGGRVGLVIMLLIVTVIGFVLAVGNV